MEKNTCLWFISLALPSSHSLLLFPNFDQINSLLSPCSLLSCSLSFSSFFSFLALFCLILCHFSSFFLLFPCSLLSQSLFFPIFLSSLSLFSSVSFSLFSHFSFSSLLDLSSPFFPNWRVTFSPTNGHLKEPFSKKEFLLEAKLRKQILKPTDQKEG